MASRKISRLSFCSLHTTLNVFGKTRLKCFRKNLKLIKISFFLTFFIFGSHFQLNVAILKFAEIHLHITALVKLNLYHLQYNTF